MWKASLDPEVHACLCEIRGGGCELKCHGVYAGLNNDDAVTVEGIALTRAVRIVIAGVAVAHAEDSATAMRQLDPLQSFSPSNLVAITSLLNVT